MQSCIVSLLWQYSWCPSSNKVSPRHRVHTIMKLKLVCCFSHFHSSIKFQMLSSGFAKWVPVACLKQSCSPCFCFTSAHQFRFRPPPCPQHTRTVFSYYSRWKKSPRLIFLNGYDITISNEMLLSEIHNYIFRRRIS